MKTCPFFDIHEERAKAHRRAASLRDRFPLPHWLTAAMWHNATGWPASNYYRRRAMWLTWDEADHLAIRLGRWPEEIWPEFPAIADRLGATPTESTPLTEVIAA